jgi:short-subunit dehydrogenase
MPDPIYALITGASSGIGACFARALAGRGRDLVLVARSEDKLAALAQELASKHALRAEVVPVDLSEPGAAGRLAQILRERNLAIMNHKRVDRVVWQPRGSGASRAAAGLA